MPQIYSVEKCVLVELKTVRNLEKIHLAQCHELSQGNGFENMIY